MKHKEYCEKWCKWAKHTYCTHRERLLQNGLVGVSNTLFFRTTPFFTKPSLFNKIIWMPNQSMLQKIQKYLWQIHQIIIFTNKLLLQLEASNWQFHHDYNFTVIIIMYWHGIYKGNNKYNDSNSVLINQTVPREVSKYFCSKLVYQVILKGNINFWKTASLLLMQ